MIISNQRYIDLTIDFIMVCETYLTYINRDMFPLDGYNFIHKGHLHFQVRDDLTVNHDTEFESIFVEMGHDRYILLIGAIYRVPGTNDHQSVDMDPCSKPCRTSRVTSS